MGIGPYNCGGSLGRQSHLKVTAPIVQYFFLFAKWKKQAAGLFFLHFRRGHCTMKARFLKGGSAVKRLVLLLALILSLCVPVLASEASLVQSNTVVAADGSCQVSLNITLQVDSTLGAIPFPIPLGAENVTLGGEPAQTRLEENRLEVLLPVSSAGSHSFQLSYRLPQAVEYSQEVPGGYTLTLPILSGFAYPVKGLEFTVKLPGDVPAEPVFSSGYHQTDIARHMVSSISGDTVSGALTQSLKDHETLTMTLEAPMELFPGRLLQENPLDGWDIAVIVCVLLAAVYYLLTLLPVLPKRVRCYTAPEFISAGEVGTTLTGSGPELTLMVIHWAQLGYLSIVLEGQRVVLRKRMEMGNERSNFEMRIFQTLFRTRDSVSGSSLHYAQLYKKVSVKSPLRHQLFLPASGNPKIFRALAIIPGIISGVQLGLAVDGDRSVQILLAVAFGLLCGAFSYFIQSGGKCLPLRDKSPLYLSLGCMLLWLALGVLLRETAMTAPMVILQFVCGLGAAYGGRRSERGKRCMAELMSLRRYMTAAPTAELLRLLQGNPNYYYELAPYALAMGVDKQFSRRFGKMVLPDQSFLILNTNRSLTASEFAAYLRRAADVLNATQKKLPYRKK